MEEIQDEPVPPEYDPATPVEQQALAPEQGVAMEVAMDIQTPVINDLMMALCYPENTDSFFLSMAGQDSAALSKRRPTGLPPNIEMLLNTVNATEFYMQMVNSGNMIEIAAWNQALSSAGGPGFNKWKTLSQAVLGITSNPTLHALRCRIYKPLQYGGDSSTSSGDIRTTKQSILAMSGVPPGVNPDELSWDAISFKVPPTSSEIFCYKNPQMVQQLSQEQLGMIDKVEEMVEAAIQEKCSEFRQRMNTVADEFLPDLTLYLEQQLAGLADADRSMRIESIGRGVLISYVDKMQNLFCSGNLPAAIQPSKIYGCHDVITASELRASIMKLSETQVVQQSTAMNNPTVMNRAYQLAKDSDLGGSNWTKQQQASILIKRNVDEFMRRAQATLGVRYDNPMRNLENQLAGSSNTLGQELQAQSQQPVVQQTEQQLEVSKNQLSVLLACLRMRANATQQSDWELLAEDDLDHMEIVKFLSHQTSDPSSGNDILYRTATLLQEEYSNGHNIVKFQGKSLPPELIDMVNYTIEGRAKALLGGIPAFSSDMNQGGMALKILMYCIIHSIAQRQRIAMETKQRTEKRLLGIQV